MATLAPNHSETQTVTGYCGLCAVHCPTVTRVEGQRVLSVEPDPSHPYGGAICSKGRAAPEMHDHPDRVNYPLRRTRPKTDPDPGWERCSWDEALQLIARKLLEVRASSGPQAVAFSKGTSGGTGLTDSEPWLARLTNYLGTPNVVSTTHLCQWPRDTGAAFYTFGTQRLVMPDTANSGCVVLWGSNPNANFLSLARDVAAARARGAKLLVVDPRRIGLANKADLLLQLRPGTDGALVLSLIHWLIENAAYDEGFVREWTNAPFLVREDTGRLLLAGDIAAGSPPTDAPTEGVGPAESRYVAADQEPGRLLVYVAERGAYEGGPPTPMLRGERLVTLSDGRQVRCRPVFEQLARIAAEYRPEVAAEVTGVPAEQIAAAARLLAEHRPVSHYFHNGLVQHTNATQASRGIEVLYALLGDFDRPGGNVPAPGPHVNGIQGRTALPAETARQRLGRSERPVGPPAVPGSITAYDLYRAVLEGEPYPIRALVAFGGNMLLANGDSLGGREALQRLEFFAQVELWHTPTSKLADVLLPAASFLESDELMLGFRYPIEAMAHVQRRSPAVPPLHERRSDVEIIFALASRLGLGEHFWGGDTSAAYDHVLEPSGVSWQALAQQPHGISIPKQPLRYRKYAEPDAERGAPRGFGTPTRKVELYSTAFAAHGYPPLPVYSEPSLSPASRPELAQRFPLVLTNAKKAQYLHSQHRSVASLRKLAPNPTAELHPDTAAEYGITDGEWMVVETPNGEARAQAHLTRTIVPGVVCGNHGWWQGCDDLGLAPLDPFTAEGANINLLVLNDLRDPISGGTPHRSYLCRLRKL